MQAVLKANLSHAGVLQLQSMLDPQIEKDTEITLVVDETNSVTGKIAWQSSPK